MTACQSSDATMTDKGRQPAGAPLAFFLAGLLVACGALYAADNAPPRPDLSPEDTARVRAMTAPATDFSRAEPFEAMQAGAATSTKRVNRDAFSHPSANLPRAQEHDFNLGRALFRKQWVASPSPALASDGLGPLYNAPACLSCHLKNGRGHPPMADGEEAVSMFLRLSVPARSDAERKARADKAMASIPDPVYGGQLQNFAVPGMPAEGHVRIDYSDLPVPLGDGTVVTLRKPSYSISSPGYGPPDPQLMISPRVTPQMIGLGLLEQVHETDILALADPDDGNGDGISGKPGMVPDGKGGQVLGRFGWKASTPTIRQQAASAFSGDMGISTPAMPDAAGECTSAQAACRAAPNGVQARIGDTEAPDPILDLVTFYAQNLAVPARRDVEDPQVLRGKAAFYNAGCASCHTPKFVTRRDAPTPAHRFQLIWPYTDMLLHDMGEGLADHRPVGDATGSEWRTPPLWGIGLTGTVSGHTLFLHDGRARSLLEAILWHDGEARAARDAVAAMDKAERDALIRFLQSL